MCSFQEFDSWIQFLLKNQKEVIHGSPVKSIASRRVAGSVASTASRGDSAVFQELKEDRVADFFHSNNVAMVCSFGNIAKCDDFLMHGVCDCRTRMQQAHVSKDLNYLS